MARGSGGPSSGVGLGSFGTGLRRVRSRVRACRSSSVVGVAVGMILRAGSSSGIDGNRYQSLIDLWVETCGLVGFGDVVMLTGSCLREPGGERNMGLAGKECPSWVGLCVALGGPRLGPLGRPRLAGS